MEKKHFHIIIATTLFAALLWVSVNMSYEYQVYVAVPIVIENLPLDKAIATPLPKAVQLKLRGSGWRSAALALGAQPRCVLDVRLFSGARRGLALNDILEHVSIPAGILPVDMKPDSVFVEVSGYTQKRVPILMNATPAFRTGYGQVGSTVITPESVTIGGAEAILTQITDWPTRRTMFDDLKSPLDVEVALVDSASHYLKLLPSAVRLRIDVQQFAEKTVAGLPVETRDVPQNKEVILIPPKMDVVVRGGVEQLATLSNDSFHASIDYGEIVADSTGYVDAAVASPKGVQLVMKKPERMQFIIRTRL